jgi:hypothetical protein
VVIVRVGQDHKLDVIGVQPKLADSGDDDVGRLAGVVQGIEEHETVRRPEHPRADVGLADVVQVVEEL